MKYGLIGEKLSHSFSKEIHNLFADYDYELAEIKSEELENFFVKKDFCGINVTIPYKTSVIKYLDFVDDAAKEIGAVNTVVNKNGRLYGYNTDAFGLFALCEKNGIDIKGKNVLILGGGGTSKTAFYVAKSSGAKSVTRVSRTKKPGFITYKQAVSEYNDTQIIINATPVGMYPNADNMPIDISAFSNLQAVVDVIYNPIKTRLVLLARKAGINAVGGLYMLVAQAYRAAELFTGGKLNTQSVSEAYKKVLSDKQNIVLVGMPSAGKTTIGKMLSKMLDMPFFDSDERITEITGKTPAEIIREEGEPAFREIESKVLYDLSLKNHSVIATGGGAFTLDKNVLSLKSNGKIYYIDRPLDLLKATNDRPLSSSKSMLEKLYSERKNLYIKAADKRIINDKDLPFAAEEIRKDFLL